MRRVTEELIGFRPAEEKDARILQKEITFLREEDRDTREIDDLCIYFCLTEVGICRELSRE